MIAIVIVVAVSLIDLLSQLIRAAALSLDDSVIPGMRGAKRMSGTAQDTVAPTPRFRRSRTRRSRAFPG